MAAGRLTVALLAAIALTAPPPAGADGPAGSAAISAATTQDQSAMVQPEATVVGTPTPGAQETPLPLETSTPVPGQSPTPTPATDTTYSTPGYGQAALQPRMFKRQEIEHACSDASRPPTSDMLGARGVVGADPGKPWVPIFVAIAIGAAIVGVVAFRRRKRGASAADGPRLAGADKGPSVLESVAVVVAICGGLAGLAAQFVPGATIKEPPPQKATMVVRDVKPRITRQEFSDKERLNVRGVAREDLAEVGNVVWLEVNLTGFKDHAVDLSYGLYDPDARETLLPGTGKQIPLATPKHDVETIFQPVWVGYPRSRHFKAEFRLVDGNGVQQIAETGPMPSSTFRYVCTQSLRPRRAA